jgi:TolA-binding protein
MRRLTIILFLISVISGCAYFNTFYNAKTFFDEATHKMEDELSKTGKVSNSTYTIFENAATKAQKVIERYPDSKYVDDAMYIAGISNFHLQKYTIARSMFSRLTIEYPSSPYYAESNLWIARCYYESGEKEIAFNLLESFISDPKNSHYHGEAMSLAGYLALDENQEEKAFEYFNQAVELTDDLKTKSNLLFEMSQIYIDRNHLDEAMRILQEVEKLSIDPFLLAKVQLQYAKIFRIREMYEESEDLIKEMLADENNNQLFPDLELELGQVYTQQDKFEQAIQRYNTIIENYPNTVQAAKASYHLGVIYLETLGDYDNARTAFVNVSKHSRNILESTLAQAKINTIGQFISLNKEINTLEETYPSLRVAEQEPDSLLTSEIRSEYVLKSFRKAEYLAFEFHSQDSALKIYQRLSNRFKNDPYIPQVLNTWNYILRERGDTVRAEMIKNRLIRDYPYSVFSLKHLKREHPDTLLRNKSQQLIYDVESEFLNRGDHLGGIRAFKSMLDTASLDSLSRAQIHYRIAHEYDRELSNLDSAVYYYRKTVDDYKDTEFSESAQKRLGVLNRIIEMLMEDTSSDSLETERNNEEVLPDTINTDEYDD